MIVGTLDKLQVTPLPPVLAQIMREVVVSMEQWSQKEVGRYDIEGDKIFCVVAEEVSEPAAQRQSEYHLDYLDIQLLLAGAEWIGFGPTHYGEAGQSNPHPDLYFVTEPLASFVALRPGDFAIFYPKELHRPLCTLEAPAPLRKLIVKVHRSLLD